MAFNPTSKLFLIKFFLAGGIYASLMAGFTFYEKETFSIWRFLFNFIFFGAFMALFGLWEQKQKVKGKNSQK